MFAHSDTCEGSHIISLLPIWTLNAENVILCCEGEKYLPRETKTEADKKIFLAIAEAPILCPPDSKSQLIGKDPDAWKD